MLLDGFDSVEDIQKQYEISDKEIEGVEILCAYYHSEWYEGESAVLFKKNNEYHLVEAGHCSCYGLEGSWDSRIYTEKALKHHLEEDMDFRESLKFVYNFCKDHFAW